VLYTGLSCMNGIQVCCMKPPPICTVYCIKPSLSALYIALNPFSTLYTGYEFLL
jgi:hypothetical protein